MTEYYSRADYTYNGGDKNFSIPFSYINQDNIIVIINEGDLAEFEFLSSSQIQITSELTSGDKVSIRRVTPINEKMVTYTDDNMLDEEKLNLANDQLFNSMQETNDNEKSFEINITKTVTTMISDLSDALTSTQTSAIVSMTTYITQQTYQAKTQVLDSCYTKSESDLAYATKAEVNALNSAYQSTITTIETALTEILEGSVADNAEVIAEIKNEVMAEGAFYPTYTNKTAITTGYTAAKNGWIIYTVGSDANYTSIVYVNGVQVGRDYQPSGDDRVGTHSYTAVAPVKKNDVITFSGASVYFVT